MGCCGHPSRRFLTTQQQGGSRASNREDTAVSNMFGIYGVKVVFIALTTSILQIQNQKITVLVRKAAAWTKNTAVSPTEKMHPSVDCFRIYLWLHSPPISYNPGCRETAVTQQGDSRVPNRKNTPVRILFWNVWVVGFWNHPRRLNPAYSTTGGLPRHPPGRYHPPTHSPSLSP